MHMLNEHLLRLQTTTKVVLTTICVRDEPIFPTKRGHGKNLEAEKAIYLENPPRTQTFLVPPRLSYFLANSG